MKFFAAALVAFTVLTAVMTWPQALHLHDAVHDDGDPLLNAWTLAWVAHQLPRAPAHLFDANIFHPERRTLAFSETLIAPAVAAAPLQWLGAGPLLVSNLVLWSGFIVSGAGMALLVRSLTGSAGAAMLAGIAFAFMPYRIDHYPHLQLQQTQCLPFIFWAFHRLMRTRRARDGVLVGVFTAGQILSCMYYGLFLVPYMVVVCGALLIGGSKRTRPTPAHDAPSSDHVGRVLLAPALRGLLLAGVITIAAVIPLAVAYLGARATVGERGRQEVANGSASPLNYLGPPPANLLYGQALERFADDERRLFPGFIALALAAAGLLAARGEGAGAGEREKEKRAFRGFAVSRFRADSRWAYALGLLVAFDISLGFNGWIFPWLYDYLVPFRALRIPARMGLFAGFSLAVLAGYGAARLRRPAIVALGALMLVEYASRPLTLQPIVTAVPRVYADLARDIGEGPQAPIAEYPMSKGDDPTYMFYSTSHWQPMVNGYSGFFPPSYYRFSDSFQGFPDEEWIAAVRERRLRYVLIHGERMIGNRYERLIAQLEATPDFALVSRSPSERYGQHGEVSLYRVVYR